MRQIQGLDRRIVEEAYNPVYGNKKGYRFSIPETAFEWVEGVFQASCLVIDGSNYRWVFIALLG